MSETTRLDWIPMGSPRLRPPAGLTIQQEAWWWRLFWALFDHGKPQGYLSVNRLPLYLQVTDLRYWNVHKRIVLAPFEVMEENGIADEQVVFYPPLIQALETQRKKLLTKRGRGGISKSENGGLPLSLLQLGFDFDLKEEDRQKFQSEEKCVRKKPQKSETGDSQAPHWSEERDLREMAKAYREAEQRPSSVGGLDDNRFFEWVCRRAGITVTRGLYLEEKQRAWPKAVDGGR